MNNEEILEKLLPIFHEELDNEEIVLSRETTADDIEEYSVDCGS